MNNEQIMKHQQMYLNMCIQQGYVPKGCTFNGVIAWMLVQKGKMPCSECLSETCNVRVLPAERQKEPWE